MNQSIEKYVSEIKVANRGSHKGENGRVLVIGGSKLFHAAVFWAADVASRVVDLVHFTSPAMENNDLVRVKVKEGFWSGIVIPWEDVEEYIREDDSILIGPGMPRAEGEMDGDVSTSEVVNRLLRKYPEKKWVVDGGALQVVDTSLLNSNMIITPHEGEYERVFGEHLKRDIEERKEQVRGHSGAHKNVVILSKSEIDVVSDGVEVVSVEGGNPGMTKGGTGDVLAGLVVALYSSSLSMASAVVASDVNKKAGELLEEEVGLYYNSSDLVMAVPEALYRSIE